MTHLTDHALQAQVLNKSDATGRYVYTVRLRRWHVDAGNLYSVVADNKADAARFTRDYAMRFLGMAAPKVAVLEREVRA